MADKIVVIVCVFGGFLWLRSRARSLNLEHRMTKVVVGVFLLLPALLLAENHLFQRLPFEPLVNTLLKAPILIATFAAIGYGFLRPAPQEKPG